METLAQGGRCWGTAGPVGPECMDPSPNIRYFFQKNFKIVAIHFCLYWQSRAFNESQLSFEADEDSGPNRNAAEGQLKFVKFYCSNVLNSTLNIKLH